MAAAYVAPTWREQLQAALVAGLCSILFLGSGLLPGRALLPYAPELEQPMAAEAIAAGELSPVELARGSLAMGDKLHQSLTWDRILQERLGRGEIPHWTRDIAGGASFVPQMAQVYQPWNLLLLVWPSTEIYGVWFLLHQLLLGWLAYRFLRRIGTAHASAVLGMVAVVIGLYTQSRLHQNVIVSAALPLFPMLSSVHAILRCGAGARSVGCLALASGISWLSGFPVVSLQMTFLTAAYALFLTWELPGGQRLAPLSRCGAGLALGGVLSLAQMIPVLVAAGDSARPELSMELLAGRSLEWDYLGTLLWPDLLHWPADHFYVAEGLSVTRQPWSTALLVGHFQELGFNYSETAFAIGIPALLAAVVAFSRRDGQVWFFGGVCLVAFLLACATFPLLQLASIAPGFGSADLKRVVFLIGFCLPVLTAIGADRLTAGEVPRWLLRLAAIICALSAALALSVALMTPDSIISWFATLYALGPIDEGTRFLMETGRYASVTDAVQAQIQAVALPDEAAVNREHLLITFLRATVIAGSAWVVLRMLSPPRRLWGLLVLTAAELLHAGGGTVVAVPAERVTTPPAILAPLLAEASENGVRPRLQRLMAPDNDDLLPLFAPNLGAFHGIEDLAAYNPLPPRRMEEFFLAIEPPDPSRRDVVFGGAGVSAFRRAESLGHPLLDVVGLRYVLTEGPLEAPGLVDRTPADAAEPFHLYERTTSLPRATFVQRMIIVPDRRERLRLLADPQRSAADEVVLENLSAPKTTETPAAATVRILEHRDELVRIQVRNQAPGYLRLADPYDPGWTVTDNGEPREIYIADHYLRAVYLEPGDHVVEFRFDGMVVVWPERISLLALGIIALCLWPYRRRP